MSRCKLLLRIPMTVLSPLLTMALFAAACNGDGTDDTPTDTVGQPADTMTEDESREDGSENGTSAGSDDMVEATNIEALFFPIFRPEGDLIAEQVREVSGFENTVLLGADGLLSDDFLALPQSEGMYFSGPDLRYGSNTNEATGKTPEAFLVNYERFYDESPSAGFWGHSYDATTILLDAIEAASTVDGDQRLVIDRAGVRQYFDELRNYSGITGSLSCDTFGDCGAQKIAIIHHTDSNDVSASKDNVNYEFAGNAGVRSDDAIQSELPLGDGSLGVVVVVPGEAIQIRSLQIISGDNAPLGLTNERAIRMAVEDFGEIRGFEVEVGPGLDDLCSADGGQAAAQTIVADERVVGVIGTSCSGAAVAAAPLLTEAGITMVSSSNTSPSLTSDLKGNPGENYTRGYYRTAHNDLFQGEAMARFVYESLNLKTAAAIHDGDPYTQGLAEAFANAYRDLGGEIVQIEGISKGDTDMVPVLTSIAAAS
ncbi:MAG: ABC transporter substrate-binding protein [Acidimicrobiaceae bacterium]|nr:ABC transporter substrate-binding protein [Acidimicrobiaceae bacterium]